MSFWAQETLHKIDKKYYWQNINNCTDINNWIKSSVDCFKMKGVVRKHNAILQSMPATGPGKHVACDAVGLFPSVCLGNKHIVFQDITAWPESFSTSATDTIVIGNLLLENKIFTYRAQPTLPVDTTSLSIANLSASIETYKEQLISKIQGVMELARKMYKNHGCKRNHILIVRLAILPIKVGIICVCKTPRKKGFLLSYKLNGMVLTKSLQNHL